MEGAEQPPKPSIPTLKDRLQELGEKIPKPSFLRRKDPKQVAAAMDSVPSFDELVTPTAVEAIGSASPEVSMAPAIDTEDKAKQLIEETGLARAPEIREVESLLESFPIVIVSGDMGVGKTTMMREATQYFQAKGREVYQFDGHNFALGFGSIYRAEELWQWLDSLPENTQPQVRPILLFDSGDYLYFQPTMMPLISLNYGTKGFDLVEGLMAAPELFREMLTAYLKAQEQARLAETVQIFTKGAADKIRRDPARAAQIWAEAQAHIAESQERSKANYAETIPEVIEEAPKVVEAANKQAETISRLYVATLHEKCSIVLTDHEYTQRGGVNAIIDRGLEELYNRQLKDRLISATFELPESYHPTGAELFVSRQAADLPNALVKTIAEETTGIHFVLKEAIKRDFIGRLRTLPEEEQRQAVRQLKEETMKKFRGSTTEGSK